MLGSILHFFPHSHHYAKCTELVCQLKATLLCWFQGLERESQTLWYSNNGVLFDQGRLVGRWMQHGGGQKKKQQSIHLVISALHFPGNRWKWCIKTLRGNPGQPGMAEAWPGSGGARGHLFCALNRLQHSPSLQ